MTGKNNATAAESADRLTTLDKELPLAEAAFMSGAQGVGDSIPPRLREALLAAMAGSFRAGFRGGWGMAAGILPKDLTAPAQ